MSDEVTITIDGKTATVASGSTIFEAASTDKFRIPIPTVCHMPPQAPAGVCRVCVVEAKPKGGTAKLVAACHHVISNEMTVVTSNPQIAQARRTLVELLMADHPSPCAREKATRDCELEQRAREFGADPARFAPSTHEKSPFAGWQPGDDSHPNILVDHDACIVCDRCVRGCTDQAENFVIGRAGKGNQTVITFDDGRLMGESDCVSCGECMASCPTGALMNRGFRAVEWKDVEAATPVTAKRLLEIDGPVVGPDGRRLRLFAGISEKYLSKVLGDVHDAVGRNENAVVQRTFRKGQTICTMGEQGFTAYYIVSGKVRLSIPRPEGVTSVPGTWRGLFRRMVDETTTATDATRPIPVDASVDLDPEQPIAEIAAGNLFGEMSCLNYYPRSATVTAAEDTVVLEMIRPVLLLLMRSKTFGKYLEDLYAQRSLEAIRNTPPLKGVPEKVLEELRPSMQLLRYKPGDVIFEQGDKADAFYMVRVGFVKVTWKPPLGSEIVVAYRGRGEFVGEMALLDDVPRTATCSAADHVDLVRIPLKEFNELRTRNAEVQKVLRKAADERKRSYELDPNAQARHLYYEDAGKRGLLEGQSLLLLDLDRCTRCDLCAQACDAAHADVTRLVREGLRVTRVQEGKPDEHYLVATSCRQCRDPLCMFGCPVGSIHRNKSLNITIASWCIGCGVCADNCPYGNINMITLPGTKRADVRGQHEPAHQRATACDLCAGLGENHQPSCVLACPHGAAKRIDDPKEFFGFDLTPHKSSS